MTSLRTASTADAEGVADVLIASRLAFLPYAPSARTGAEVHAWVRGTLLPTRRVVVAETDGVIIGVLATAEAEGCGWIEQLYLLPGHTGQGVGTLLLQHAHGVLPRPIRLYTFQQNTGARRFYERHGYKAIAFTDGQTNEERCPDVLYELGGGR